MRSKRSYLEKKLKEVSVLIKQFLLTNQHHLKEIHIQVKQSED